MPFVVAWPGRVKPGIYDQPVIQLDIHATALAAAGVAARPDWRLEGVDLLPHLDVDMARFEANLEGVHPGAAMLLTSAKTGEGVDELADWLLALLPAP